MSQPCPPLYPDRWLDLYRSHDYEQLSDAFLAILDHFREQTYFRLDDSSQYFINAFTKHFLYLFSQADYTLSDRHIHRFIQHNLTVSNLVALSSFKTTDAYLDLLLQQSQNFVKILTLYSARNRQYIDPKVFFDADAPLACLWYCYFLESYRSGLLNPTVSQKLQQHLAYQDERLRDFYNLSEIYLGATYINDSVGDGGDRAFKGKINRSVQTFLQPLQSQIQNQPNPRKIAIITAKWFKTHVVYRTVFPLLKAIAQDYDLTLVHLGPVLEPVELSLFKEVQYIAFEGNNLNLKPLLHNDFAAVYYPDIGMNTESILLSNLRLAPIQITGAGHPMSTGGSQIDYFVSGAEVELPTAQHYYAEKLKLLPGLGAVHQPSDYIPLARQTSAPLSAPPAVPPTIPSPLPPNPPDSPPLDSSPQAPQALPSPEQTPLPEPLEIDPNSPDRLILNCPWMSPKVSAPLIQALQRILDHSPRSVLFRFFSSGLLRSSNDFLPFERELQAALGADRVALMPYARQQDYLAQLDQGHLSLDSFPFGGSNVVADSLYLAQPIVVLEGDRWYNRIGPQLLRRAGLEELITQNPDQYCQKALELMADDRYRAQIRHHLQTLDLAATVFNPEGCWAFKPLLDTLIRQHYASLAPIALPQP